MSAEIKPGDRCPLCGSNCLSNQDDFDQEAHLPIVWIHCDDCGHNWTWADDGSRS